MQTWRLIRLVAVCFLFGLWNSPTAAFDWGLSGGVHQMTVPEADSSTGGFNIAIHYRHFWGKKSSVSGVYRIYLDNDEDELDPDHYPIWMRTRHRFESGLHRWSSTTHLFLAADLSHKRNTVSSVEWQVRLIPALGVRFESERGRSSLIAGVGYYGLEIDDDVPAQRGYTRDDLRNQTAALWLRADGGVKIAGPVALDGRVEYWADGDGSLEFQYGLDLSFDTRSWVKNSRIVLEAEGTQYNLDPYTVTGPGVDPRELIPILPWDHDFLLQLTFGIIW